MHDILPDNDLVPLIQLGDEQHITTGEENKSNNICLFGGIFGTLKTDTLSIFSFISDSKAILQSPLFKA